MFDRVDPNIVSGKSNGWQSTRELLGGEHSEVGVFSLEEGTGILNSSKETVPLHGFRIDDIDAVKGNYVVFPEEIVTGLREQVDADFIGPEDMNDSNFYVGQSTGVPWFELKLERDYTIPVNEAPHIHEEAWEVYNFNGGEAILDVANKSYDFENIETDEWHLREGVSQLQAFDGDTIAIPPGVPHQVNSQSGNPDLMVVKYSYLGQEGDIGKYSIDGTRVDPWAENGEEMDMDYIKGLD